MLHTIDRRKSKQIGHILRVNCFLKHFIEQNIGGRIKVIEVKGRIRKQLLADFGKKRRTLVTEKRVLYQRFSTFVRPQPGKFLFHKTRARSQQIYSSVPFHFFKFMH